MLWLGDVFDHPRPTYRSFRVAQRALARIREHGVPAVVISGNHDTPRLPGTGSPYSALADSFPEMHFAHRLAYERFELPGLVVHAVPQMLTVEAALEALDEAARQRSATATNLLITHPRLTQLQPRHADINEIEVDARPAAIRPGSARPLPRPRPGVGGHVVRGVDRHVQLRRRPRAGQGHRGARHRHAAMPPRPPGRAAPPRDAGAGLCAGTVARRAAGAGAASGPQRSRPARWPGCTSSTSTPRSTG